jgi:hypothetical protein
VKDFFTIVQFINGHWGLFELDDHGRAKLVSHHSTRDEAREAKRQLVREERRYERENNGTNHRNITS